MLVLGLETATEQVGVAIGGSDGLLASFRAAGARRHAETLTPAVDFLCRQAGVTMADLDLVAVDVGPGLFTGLRVGIATGKAIAYARGIPILGLSSLELLAFPVRLTDRRIVPVVDARRGEVYHSAYRRRESGGIEPIQEPAVSAPSALARHLAALDEECLLVGNGVRRYADAFSGLEHCTMAPADFDHPSAEAMIGILGEEGQEGQDGREAGRGAQSDLEILYLRPPDTDGPPSPG
ncbi:MAG: tRNA (adenosine(37)-N6)-threonylcarbamoyltransferase complex dimerization subunit type 1 TsaB [Acidobacteriota bacterium]|jgi:tRNA threonylcarbamoyladenosine biosynthesis protein TsaB